MWYPYSNTVIHESSDILSYLYMKHKSDPVKEAFLRQSEESEELMRKIDQMGVDIRSFVYYQVNLNFFNRIRFGSTFEQSGVELCENNSFQDSFNLLLKKIINDFFIRRPSTPPPATPPW